MKVKKDRHYPSWRFPFKPIIYWKNRSFVKYIKFAEDSLFIFEGDDIYDYSKLFGISFGHHHKNESYRFGFRMLDNEEIDISLYTYVNGERKIDESITSLDFNKEYKFTIDFYKDTKVVFFEIKEVSGKVLFTAKREINKFRFWGYQLGLYIGGNNPATNDIDIEIKKG